MASTEKTGISDTTAETVSLAISRTLRLLAPERSAIALLTIYGLGISILSLAIPLTGQALVSTVAFGQLLQPLVVLAVLLSAALIGASVLNLLQMWVSEIIQRRLFARLSEFLPARLASAPLQTLRDKHAPELVNRFFDLFTVHKSLAVLLISAIDALLVILSGLLILAFYHPYLLMFDVILVGGALVVLGPLGRGGTISAIKESKAKYKIATWFQEIARHKHLFRQAQARRVAEVKSAELATEFLRYRAKHFQIVFRQMIGIWILHTVASVAILTIGGLLVIERQLTMGQLVASELVVNAVVFSLAKLGSKIETYYDLIAASDKLGELYELPTEDEEVTRSMAQLSNSGIRFSDVQLPCGERVSFDFGSSGVVHLEASSEKSAEEMADVLFGLLRPVSGQYFIGGVDSRDVELAELRRHLHVLRDVEVLAGSVWQNLSLANSELTAERAWDALHAARLDEVIREFPDSFDTVLSWQGYPLSRVQILKLVIARAVASGASIIVLDRLLDHLADGARNRLLTSLNKVPNLLIVVLATKE